MKKDLTLCLLLDIYGQMITEKQYEVMDYYYNQDLSLAEISEHLGITRQGVRDSIKRGEQVLLDFESKLKLLDRFFLNQKKIGRVQELMEKVGELNRVQLRNNLLHQWMTEMEQIVSSLQT